MVPLHPTATPVLASVNETAYIGAVVPLVWVVQAVPPLVVRRIAPDSATAVMMFASMRDRPFRLEVVPLG
jgi:hypothetical protein